MSFSCDLEIFLEYLVPNVRYGTKYRPHNRHSNGDIGPRKTQQNRFFAKMAPKTTSGSGFHFIFQFFVVDLVNNATNLENDPLHIFEKFYLKVEQFQQYLNELREFPTCNFWYVVAIVALYDRAKIH